MAEVRGIRPRKSFAVGANILSKMKTIVMVVVAFAMLGTDFALTSPAAGLSPLSVPTDTHQRAIEIDLALSKAPKIGEETSVQATLETMWFDLDDVVIRLTAGSGLAVEGSEEYLLDLTLNQPQTVTFSVTPSGPGDHRVAVKASAQTTVGTALGHGQGFLRTPQAGSGGFLPDVIPPGPYSEPAVFLGADGPSTGDVAGVEGLQPGAAESRPLKPLPPNQPDQSGNGESGGEDEGPIGVQSHSTFQVRVCWFYRDESDANFLPSRFTWMEVYDQDASGGDDLLTSGITGNDGCFLSSSITRAEECCGLGNQDVYLRFVACQSAVCVKDGGGAVYNGFTGVQTVGSEDIQERGSFGVGTGNSWAWRVFQYANNAWDFAINRAAYATAMIDMVDIVIPSPTNSCTNDGPACYVRAQDTMYLKADGFVDESSDVVGHEFGHSVHWKSYGLSYWPSPGGAHNLCTDGQDRGLAWAEGYANFFGARADNEIFPIAGATGDSLMAGSNIESGSCGVFGDDNEWNVAQSLWDLRDSVDDGIDVGVTEQATFIHDVIRNCDDFSYRDYYDGAGVDPHSTTCNWDTQGGFKCNFVKTSDNNGMSFNVPAIGNVASQGSFAWVSGTITISATASDTEGCTPSVQFYVSDNNICSTGDAFAGTDATPGYAVNFNTATIPNDSTVWTCMRPHDGVVFGGFDISNSQIGVDNTPPSVDVSVSCGVVGENGWCRAGSASFIFATPSDSLSGLASSSCIVNGGSISCGSTFTTFIQGTHTASTSATDLAGNTAGDSAVIKLDFTAPSGAVTVPSTCVSSCVVDWNAQDFVSALSGSVTVRERNTITGADVVRCSTFVDGQTTAAGQCQLTATVPLPGSYCYRLTGKDRAGNPFSTLEDCTAKV